MPQVGGAWYPDTNPLLGISETVGQIQQNSSFPLRQQQMQLTNTGLGITNQTNQTALQAAYTTNLRGVIASVPKPTDPSAIPAWEQQVRSAVQRSAGSLYPQQMADAWFGGVNMPGAPSISDLSDQAVQAAGNATEVNANIGQTVQTNVGGKIVGQNIRTGPGGSNITAATGEGANLATTLTPSEEAGYVPIKRNDGSVVNVPRSDIENPDGTGKPNVAGPDGQPLTGAHGEVLGALPAGQEGALASGVQNQQDRANALQTAFEGSAQRKALLQELLQTNGEFRSGPGAKFWADAVTEFNRAFNTNFSTDAASAQQVFGKISAMIAAQQRDTLGLPATNAGEAAAEIAAPNHQYSTAANEALIGQLTGNEDLLQKKQAAWTKFQKAGGQYNDFVGQFNRAYDPRFFWDAYVPDAQKAEASMTPAQQKEYERRRERAMALKF